MIKAPRSSKGAASLRSKTPVADSGTNKSSKIGNFLGKARSKVKLFNGQESPTKPSGNQGGVVSR